MIIAPSFVYIHLPKTGGTFFESVISRVLSDQGVNFLDTSTPEGKRALGVENQHQMIWQIPASHRHKSVAFTVRNPYDHYVSFYEFGWWKNHPGDTFDDRSMSLRYLNYPDLTFVEYMESMYQWALLDNSVASAEERQLCQSYDIGPMTLDYLRFLSPTKKLPGSQIAACLNEGRRHFHLEKVRFLRCENLNADVYKFLRELGFDPAAVGFVLGLDRIYPCEKRRDPSQTWQEYFTPELQDLVRSKERYLFDLFPEYDQL